MLEVGGWVRSEFKHPTHMCCCLILSHSALVFVLIKNAAAVEVAQWTPIESIDFI